RLDDPERRMMSPAQEAWLGRELSRSVAAGHAWQIVGTGVVMGRLRVPVIGRDLPADFLDGVTPEVRKLVEGMQPIAQAGLPFSPDMWDGYPADRERVYAQIKAANA